MAPHALLHRRTYFSLSLVTARRSRSALMAALLALLAMLGVAALSGWDGATFHADDPIHAASVRHDRIDDIRRDPDGAVHLAAHATGHGIAIPNDAATPTPPLETQVAWTPGVAIFGPGLTDASLLRPPRG